MRVVHMKSDADACATVVQSLDIHMNDHGATQTCAVFDLDDTIILHSGEPRKCVQSLLDTCCAYDINVFIVTAAHTGCRGRDPRRAPNSGVGPYTSICGRTRSRIRTSQWKYNVRCQIANTAGHMLFSVGDQWWDGSCNLKIDELELSMDPSACYILTDRSTSRHGRGSSS